MSNSNISRNLLYMDDPHVDGIKKLTETLTNCGVDPGLFIRTIPLKALVKNLETDEMRSEIPGLRSIFPQIKETLSISSGLAQVKVADIVLEGAEPFGFWKQVWRVEQMDTPKLSIPKSSSSDLIPYLADLKYTDGTGKKIEGGSIGSIDFDCADDKGYYAVAAQVKRNWLRDNNFRALEVHLRQLGEAWYYRIGEYLFQRQAALITTYTDTKANLDGASNTNLEAIINVLESKIPGQRYTADTVIMNPTDAYSTKVQQWGTAGPIPLLSSQYFDRQGTNVSSIGLANLLGVNNVWVTPWATAGTILAFSKDKNFIVGLRQDLEFEDWNDTLKGLVGSATSMRFDQQLGYEAAGYKITSV